MLGENDSYSRSSEISSHSAPPETEKINVSLELRLNSIFFLKKKNKHLYNIFNKEQLKRQKLNFLTKIPWHFAFEALCPASIIMYSTADSVT